MSTILFALALAMQTAPTPPQQPQPTLRYDPYPPQSATISPAHDLYYEESNRLTRATRVQVDRFGACVAQRSNAHASDVLNRDFTTNTYRNALRRLARHNRDCYRQRARLRSNLIFAGAMAEQLLERDSAPLNVRLARAALRPATTAYSAADRVALCVVRSVPDDVARLFASELDSDGEAAAIRALALPIRACSGGGPRLDVTAAAVRAILATAAFRSVAQAATASATPLNPEAAA